MLQIRELLHRAQSAASIFSLARPLCERLLFASGRSYIFTQRQRSPAAPCAPYGGSPCSTPSFCVARGFESRKLVSWRRKWLNFRFWGQFGVFWAILGRKTGTFSHFLRSRHPSARVLRFLGPLLIC